MKLLIQIFRFLFPKDGMEEANEFMRIYARRERRKKFFELISQNPQAGVSLPTELSIV